MTGKRKRFIAGAVCPQCQSQDRLALWRQEGVDNIVCVECGYTQRQSDGTIAKKSPAKGQIIGIFDPE